MVDLERHSVVDVLEDRSVESAKSWLQERPSIEVVSRDRCGSSDVKLTSIQKHSEHNKTMLGRYAGWFQNGCLR
ncbi:MULTISPECIES: hypothetical protein [unclassified Rhizobium]|uniref:hypothetical protein n=1 Tax=unclassified Rhizobium TaxID=2613769 RepID=UPI00380ED97F